MLGLRQPSWTDDGEILNLDRFAGHPPDAARVGARFTTREKDPRTFGRLTEFLDTVARREGFAYKDVVHPFVVSAWSGLGKMRVLHVRRDPAEVAYAMLRRQWYYPAAADPAPELDTGRRGWRRGAGEVTISEAVVRGLVRAQRALDAVTAERVDFTDVLPGQLGVATALERLYPGVELRPLPPTTDEEIRIGHARREEIRRSEEYGALLDLVAKARESLA